jgi:MYXO-CTERM domain-containing protein
LSWSSAGRVHHARSLVRRYLYAGGGCVDQTGNYSWGAAQMLRGVYATSQDARKVLTCVGCAKDTNLVTNAATQFSVANNISVARPGVGQAFVSNSITVTNTSTFATQNLQFFLMVDSQILGLGTGGNDRFGAATGSLVGSTRVIQFEDVGVTNPGSGGGAYTVNFGADNAGAWEAGTETTAGSNIRTRLASSTNGTTNALSNSISFTTGDPFGGYTWNVSLAPGASATFTGYIGVNTAVPTPGAMALLGLGGLAAARRRRR